MVFTGMGAALLSRVPFLKPIIELAKAPISIPVFLLVGGLAFGWVLHVRDVKKQINDLDQKIRIEEAKKYKEATEELAKMADKVAQQSAEMDTLKEQTLTALEKAKQEEIKRIEAENKDPDIVRVPDVRTVTLKCEGTKDAEPKILECPKPKACPRVRRKSCLDQRIPPSVLQPLR